MKEKEKMLKILRNTGMFVLGTILVVVVFGLPMVLLGNLFIGWFGAYSWLGMGLYFLSAITYVGLLVSTMNYWTSK